MIVPPLGVVYRKKQAIIMFEVYTTFWYKPLILFFSCIDTNYTVTLYE